MQASTLEKVGVGMMSTVYAALKGIVAKLVVIALFLVEV